MMCTKNLSVAAMLTLRGNRVIKERSRYGEYWFNNYAIKDVFFLIDNRVSPRQYKNKDILAVKKRLKKTFKKK